MKKISALLFLALLTTGALAQNKETAFKNGETLLFMVSYRAKLWPNTDMGTVEMKVGEEKLGSAPTYKVSAYATVLGEYRWFYKLDDHYYSWLCKQTLRPLLAQSEISEGSYRFSSMFTYDWCNMSVTTKYRRHTWAEARERTMKLESNTMEGLSILYNLRSTDLQSLKPGEENTLSLLSSDTIKTIKYKFIGRETKKIQGLGSVKTLKFSFSMATLSDELTKEGTPFYIWITDDANKVPVFFESPVVVGSVRVRLIDYKNLKYPDKSVLKK